MPINSNFHLQCHKIISEINLKFSESDIKPIIIEYTENLLEKLQSSSDLYKRHLQRLQVIRKSKVSIHEDFSTKNGTELLRFEKGYAESIASGISTLRSVR